MSYMGKSILLKMKVNLNDHEFTLDQGRIYGGARGGKAHPKFLESSILTFIVILSYY